MNPGSGYDVLLVDLDGTVYRGPTPIAGAVEALESVRGTGVAVSYVTNNASRSPAAVRDHLVELGLTVAEDEVVTSAQAAAAVLADDHPAGSRVLVLGTDALVDELRAVGLTPVREADDDPVAVVQGHSPETGWRHLAEAALALTAGCPWVACNADPTLPSERGTLPGNGSFVGVLRTTTGREPRVAGKPQAPLLRQAVDRAGSQRPLVVGDRLDTDVAGAAAIDADALLVLTGVSTAAEVLAAVPGERPALLAADLTGLPDLLDDPDAVRVGAAPARGWRVTTLDDHDEGADVVVLALEHAPGRGGDDGDGDQGDGDGSDDHLAALRTLCAVSWDRRAEGAVRVRPGDDAAAAAVDALDLPRETSR